MSRLPSYVKRDADWTYYIRFKIGNTTYTVRGFRTAGSAMEHKFWLESQILNGLDYRHKIMKTSLS